MNARIDVAFSKGCDGVGPDNGAYTVEFCPPKSSQGLLVDRHKRQHLYWLRRGELRRSSRQVTQKSGSAYYRIASALNFLSMHLI